MKAALNNEKIKYKIRISQLKFFGEKFLIEANNITDKTFQNLDDSIIKSVDAQNNAMNFLMETIKKDILEGKNKIIYNIELDIFNIYHKLTIPFKEFMLSLYNNLEKQDKKISIIDLNKIYLDLKNYEIQDNYVTFNSVIDIVFKKHLFEFKSLAFVNYLKILPYHYLNNLISKFIYKSEGGQNLVRIDKLFTILAILHLSPPKNSEKKEILEEVNNKLKFHCFLSKEDFNNIDLWFEKYEKKDSNAFSRIESNPSSSNINYFKSNKINNQRLNLYEFSPNKNNIIAEENYKIDNEINNDNNITNLDNFNNDNDIIIDKKDDINLNNEARIQMNNLFRNLTIKSPLKSRKTTKKITKFSSPLSKVANEEYKLKDFLFNINKNYDNQINFIEFMNVVSLQFIKGKNLRKKSSVHINTYKVLEFAKKGELENNMITDKKKNFSRKTTEFLSIKTKSHNSFHRKPTQSISNFQLHDKKLDKDSQNKKIYLGGDEYFKIEKEGDYLLVNDKKYNINNLKNNLIVEITYLDELIEDNPK